MAYWKLDAYATMLPRIAAQERVDAINDGLAHEGRSMEDRARAAFVRDLERDISGGIQRFRKTQDVRRSLVDMGVEVVEGDD